MDNINVKDGSGNQKTLATKDNSGVHIPKNVLVDNKGTIINDAITHAIPTIDYAHHEIHEGNAFEICAADTSMALGDTLSVAFKTPPQTTKTIHLILGYSSKADSHVEVIEGGLWTGGTGSAITAYNQRRSSTNTSKLLQDLTGSFVSDGTIILNPTLIAGGTTIQQLYTWTSFGLAEQSRDTNELNLDYDTTYVIKVTADAATNAAQLCLNWYEHKDSDL